jgi:hypothetical protein
VVTDSLTLDRNHRQANLRTGSLGRKEILNAAWHIDPLQLVSDDVQFDIPPHIFISL